ncbi:hypothetical protein C8T65DRAFT_745297 [Cerioporus squamosus]|nr:hypothetical protein C8T65DRAFT_745297 [Cerioporus squamosus]
MSGLNPTPIIIRSANVPTATQDTLQSFAEELWKSELKCRINIAQDVGEEFVKKFVPCNTQRPLIPHRAGLATLFSDWHPAPGQEKESYPILIRGFNALVSNFPFSKRPAFVDCHLVQQKFPFSAFARNHNVSYPDLAVTFPGVDEKSIPDKCDWSHFAMIMEAKATDKDDPFKKEGLGHCKTLVQLAINARCLMHAHGLLAAFVLGIYGNVVRIARFDHTCAVVSRRFSLKRPSHLKTIQQFFWNFVNPCEGGPIVGSDPTIRRLTLDDGKWLQERLTRIGVSTEGIILGEARRAEILDDRELGESTEPAVYILYKALDVNGRLFSRATTVWLGIRDTRRWVDGQLIDEPEPEDLKLRIIKEAWRQLVRRPERDCYERLNVIPPEEKIGLPSLLYGGDLGERETRRWEAALYQPPPSAISFSDVSAHKTRLMAPSSTLEVVAEPTPPSLVSTTSPTHQPLHRPMQQTFSWRLTRGDKYWYRERSHMRFVVDTVGRPLTTFRCTKELVTAVRDAIKGHRLAMTRAGVLHRDVSVGNVLILDNPSDPGSYAGFLHDFDYSSMSREVPTITQFSSMCATERAQQLLAEADAGDLKERTGTFYFIAIMLQVRRNLEHTVGHDLESFYWVLVWVVVRHVAHAHPFGNDLCPTIFPYGDKQKSHGAKTEWIMDHVHDFSIPGNAPLTDLIKELAKLVEHHYHAASLDYDMVLGPIEAALARDDWPENDAALPYVVPDVRTNTVGWPEETRRSKRPAVGVRSPLNAQFGDAQGSDFGDDDLESVGDWECERYVEFDLYAEPPDDASPLSVPVDVQPPAAVDDSAPKPKRRRTNQGGSADIDDLMDER